MLENDEIFTEETLIDVVGVIPAHMKNFQQIEVLSVSPNEIAVEVDGEKLKGKIGDTISTNLFFEVNNDYEEAHLVSAADKIVNLEHVFYIPKDAFTKPFIPTDAMKKPE